MSSAAPPGRKCQSVARSCRITPCLHTCRSRCRPRAIDALHVQLPFGASQRLLQCIINPLLTASSLVSSSDTVNAWPLGSIRTLKVMGARCITVLRHEITDAIRWRRQGVMFLERSQHSAISCSAWMTPCWSGTQCFALLRRTS